MVGSGIHVAGSVVAVGIVVAVEVVAVEVVAVGIVVADRRVFRGLDSSSLFLRSSSNE